MNKKIALRAFPRKLGNREISKTEKGEYVNLGNLRKSAMQHHNVNYLSTCQLT